MTEIDKNRESVNRFRLNVTAKGLERAPAWSPLVDPALHTSAAHSAS